MVRINNTSLQSILNTRRKCTQKHRHDAVQLNLLRHCVRACAAVSKVCGNATCALFTSQTAMEE